MAEAYVLELVRDVDGAISRSLKIVVGGTAGCHLHRSVVYQLLRNLYEGGPLNQCVLSDTHVDNLLVRRGEKGRSERLFIIDGMGNADFPKYCHWSKWMCQKKIARKLVWMLQLAGLEVGKVMSSR